MKVLWALLLSLAFRPAAAETGLSGPFSALAAGTRAGAENIEGRKPTAQRRSIFRIISWNVQTFGGGINPSREAAYSELLEHMFSRSRSAKVLAVQEIAQEAGAKKFSDMLPGGEERWNRSFQDTADSQDNGFYSQKQVNTHCEQFMFAKQDENGRWRSDPSKARHPVRVTHMNVGDFDFTLINLHLTFGRGDPAARVKEMGEILQWVKEYMQDPSNDPDLIIAGDFNMPLRSGRGESYDGPAIEDVLETDPAFRRSYDESGRRIPKSTELIALVDDPTSRHQGKPVNNYDHFIISGDVYDEEFVRGSGGTFPAKMMGAIEEKHDTYVSDHLPISAGFLYKGEGNNGEPIRLDDAVRAKSPRTPTCFPSPRYTAAKTK